MQPNDRPALEREIRELGSRGETSRAVEAALLGYGPEITKLVNFVVRDRELAQDAFAAFSESLLKGLPGFRWESSFRTWAYQLARNACYQILGATHRREQVASQPVPLDAAHQERSGTRPWMQTGVKERFRALRERLDAQERMLLMLRVDRKLSWTEVAEVMAEPGEALTAAALQQRATALRQQFQRLKARLRSMAQDEGIIESAPRDA